ncbi:MAG: glycosyltransferase family 2 protein [Candidatus Hydrogenedentes bacterium]|nr:glycosyltransferase family 2 protein [Candidatus Hydrogenedentota bacterium]
MSNVSQQGGLPSLSIVVPTFREAQNLPELVERIELACGSRGIVAEMLVMDDDSRDGIVEAAESLARPWLRVVVRRENRGLSAAVLDGFRLARHEVLLVMDADLSHPPEKIPEMLEALASGADFVLGSRYVRGGSTDEDWGFFRWVNSRVATLLARPFTRVADPMSGFFAFRRDAFEQAASLNPVGYKIGLEILVKCNCRDIREIPIHFSKRKHGESKLNLKEQIRYLQHLRRLAIYKFANWAHFVQFGIVGFTGTIVNLAVLTLLVFLGAPLRAAVALAILTAMVSNFVLNREFTFSYARSGPFWRQMFGFIAASSVGAVVNYATVLVLLHTWPVLERLPQVASVVGILAGLIFNFFASRYLVFRAPGKYSS